MKNLLIDYADNKKEKYIITLIGFDYENKSDNFGVIDDSKIKSFVFEAGDKESIEQALIQFISDVYDNSTGVCDKEKIVENALDKCKLPFAPLLRQFAMDNDGLTYRIGDWELYTGEQE